MSCRQIKPRLATPTPRRMSRRQIKIRLAMPVPRRNKMLLDNRPRARNPASHRLPRNSRKIRQTLVGERDRATAVPEARAPGKLLQNHLEPGTAPLDRRHRLRPTHRHLPQKRLRGKPRRQNRPASNGNGAPMNLKEALQVVSEEIKDWTATPKPVVLSKII